MHPYIRVAALAKIGFLLFLGATFETVFSTAASADAVTPSAVPPPLRGEYYFYDISETDAGPVCSQRHWFKDDGREIISSGDEVVVMRFRVEPAKFGATLYETVISTNGKPDCVGDARASYPATERQQGIYLAKDGSIVLTTHKTLSGGAGVIQIEGRFVQSHDDIAPPTGPNDVAPPPPDAPSTIIAAGAFPAIFNRPVPSGAPHQCQGNYPPEAENASRGGIALVAFTITAQGNVTRAKVTKSSGQADLDDAALACVKQWQYMPVSVNGKTVAAPWLAKVTWRADAADTPYRSDMRALRRDAWSCLWSSAVVKSLDPQFAAVLGVHVDFSPPGRVEIAASSGNKDMDAAAVDCVRRSPHLADLEKNKGESADASFQLAWWNPAGLKYAPPENIFDAVKADDLAKVNALIAAGADVNAKDDTGETGPLDWAARQNHLDIMKVLLAHGADPKARDFYGFTPLHHAAAWGGKEGVELLLAHGADANDSKNSAKAAPIDNAIHEGNEETITLLLAHGADINARNFNGDTPLLLAARLYEVRSMQAQPAATSDKASTSEIEGDAQLAAFLLAHGADVNAKDKWNNTPLHRAAWEGRKGVVELLLTHGAEINAKNVGGDTPLKFAEKQGHSDVLELLRQHGGTE
jgi:TonB family protein